MSARRERLRVGIVAAVLAAYFLAALGRVFYLCIINGDALMVVARRQHQRLKSVTSERGPIVDRNGDILALTLESASVFVDPKKVTFGAEDVPKLAHVLGLEPATITEKIDGRGRFAWLLRATSPERASAVEALRLGGIGTQSSRRRYYPHGSLAGQVLGFSGVDTQGLEGVELAYDDALRGVADSLSVQRDARGREILLVDAQDVSPKEGARVELTIDTNLQRITEEELEAAVVERKAQGGVAMVMDPMTGEILAMANVPRFDPNAGSQADPAIRRNRAVTDRYEPGSTFKAILAAAAVEADVVLPSDRVFCENGRYSIGRRTITDHDPYGWLTFSDVIKFSSNIGAAKTAERLGSERFAKTIREFGFGQRSGIDLPGEVSGTVRPYTTWRRINLATTAFGHGIDVTPLQVLRAYSAIANGGRLMRPYLVKRVVGADGTVVRESLPEIVENPISADTAKIVSQMLRGVVEGGTATAAQIDGLAVAGKTGTARKIDKKTGRYSSREHIASFVGYLPADEPRFAILVVIDRPSVGMYGGIVAAPVFRRIGEYLADRHGLRVSPQPPALPVPNPDPVQLVKWSAPMDDGMPSYIGLGMRAAVARAERSGWDVQTIGSGYVVGQDPPPGAKTIAGRKLVLRFGADLG